MKVKIELFGASRDFSSHNSLDLNLNNNSTIKDIRNELMNYLDEKFNGNEDVAIKPVPKPIDLIKDLLLL